MKAGLPLALYAAWTALACATDSRSLSQIVAVVDSDLAVPAELDRITIDVAGVATARAASADLRRDALPRSLALVHDGGPLGPVRVRARAWLGASLLLERLAIVRFEAGKTLELRLPLTASCSAAALACDGESTCDDGACVAAELGGLPAFEGKPRRFFRPAADGGGDAGPNDAGADASPAAAPARASEPGCSIQLPADGAMFSEGQSVDLSGSCAEPDAAPSDSGLHWQSDRAGQLGAGPTVSVDTLAPGTHAISLCSSAADSAARGNCASISITILAAAPTASITSLRQESNDMPPFAPYGKLEATGDATGAAPLSYGWHDSLLGQIGTAKRLSFDNPPVGKHTLSLIVTDAQGRIARASRTFVVSQPGRALFAKLDNAAMRFDSLAADSSDRVYAATPADPILFAFDGTGASEELQTVLQAPTLLDAVHDLALDEARGKAYLASQGFLVCPWNAGSGLAAMGCSRFANEECNAILSLTGSDAQVHVLAGTTRGLLLASEAGVLAGGGRRLPDVDVRGLAAVGGMAWAATTQGLFSFEPVGEASQRYGSGSGAPADRLSAVVSDSQGALWVGSQNGLGRFVPATQRWSVWRAGDPTETALVGNEIRDVALAKVKFGEQTREIVWIATTAGVSRFDPVLGSFTNFTLADGLPDVSVRSIAITRANTKLIATDVGVAAYSGW